MNDIEHKWQKARKKYLKDLKKILNYSKSKSKKEILENVALHLDEQYAEMANDKNFDNHNIAEIIKNMGNVEDYVEDYQTPSLSKLRFRKLLRVIFGTIIFISVGLIAFIGYRMLLFKFGSQPVVVETYPAQLANDVPFGKVKLHVKYDQSMAGGYSWCHTSDIARPRGTKRPYYSNDRKTCYYEAILEPSTVYYIKFNSKGYEAFRSQKSFKAAKYHTLIFATKSVDGKSTKIAQKYIDMVNENNNNNVKKTDQKDKKVKRFSIPKVVKTFPKTLSNDVNFGDVTLSVEFDQKMINRSWSWCYKDKTMYPEITGTPYYDKERKVCNMTAKLEPGKIYWIGLNTGLNTNFKSESHEFAATPYILLFSTKTKDGKPTPIPEKFQKVAKAINDNQ
ncbi:hypothetical protein AAEX28_06535 [Lentisphaerota bacterium WC36G]|nr:hypothetical protein LJT99_09400 [Lentisphaerae bacterium WC36]